MRLEAAAVNRAYVANTRQSAAFAGIFGVTMTMEKD